MSTKNYLIFDFGASNGKAIVASFDGKRFKTDIVHNFDNRPVFASGTLYWDILRLFSELKIGIQKATKKYSDISSLGIDSWAVDFGFLDKSKKLISNPVHYRDEARNSVSEVLFKIIPPRVLFKLTGGQLVSNVSLFHMFSLKEQNSIEIREGERFLMIPDIFNYYLTGEIFNEFTNSTTTLMFNQVEKKWENEILKKLDLSDKYFGEVIEPGTKIGNLSKVVCNELGTKSIPVIAPCTHDTASAIAGIPVKNTDSNWAYISIGTWCTTGIEKSELILSDDVLGTEFFNQGGAEGSNLFVKDINGLWILQQCREKWNKERDTIMSWNEIEEIALNTSSCKSYIDVDYDDFVKPQVDMPSVIAKYCRESNQCVPGDLGEVAKCIYESLAMRFRFDIEMLQKLSGKKIELLHLIGGGTKDKLLCQLTSNITGLDVITGPAETTSVGNLLMQLRAHGDVSNLNEGREVSANSSDVVMYSPKNFQNWHDDYNKYLKILRTRK
jgi:sugar (pentulose or hexulose) kinase